MQTQLGVLKMHKVESFLSRFEEIVIGALILSASVILFANVVARYVFNLGLPWAEELVRYQIVWMVFIGASVAARQGIHIGVDLLSKCASPGLAKILTLTINAIAVVFCAVLVFYGAELTMQAKEFGQITAALEVPAWTVQLAIPVGSALMGIRFAQHFYRTLFDEVLETQLEFIG
jgi:C4-dicarboxylate transporter DctQ subunit